ncbi:motile sperm domain-containing protein 2-like [Zeugodacus cucurbitae]|uniref:motile sperm domain-containing protein 2-like n=1 Tax=Zeugodacus cucurbitae TaxID=28588 RepID=UPI0023D91B99|nr:motile sperm domain-containing protein 2-like [Zeugodacus cucurbitae]
MPVKVQTPTQNQIVELRNLFNDKYEQSPPAVPFHHLDLERIRNGDMWLTRFLEMYDLDMQTSIDKLWETCIWRQQYGTNELNENNLVKEYLHDGVIFARNKDLDGKTLLIFRTKLHVKGTKNMDEVIRVVVYWIERIQRETDMDKMTIFFDMAGTGVSSMDMDFVKRIIETFKLYYPNALNYILIFEMAWVLNAAFKIIKGFLPAKALEILKMISKKDINQYIDKANCLASWGGNDLYEFKFVPEKLKRPTTLTVISNGALPSEPLTPESPNGNEKKVHFANNNRMYAGSEMPECERGYQTLEPMSTMLRISPNDNIYFNRGENSESLIEITCIGKQAITYKIQTTSPEKFRVRPRCGYLAPSETVSVNIMLKQDYHLGEAPKDKFLVMCMPAPVGIEPSQQSMSEAWKMKPQNGNDVEQHRLTCNYRSGTSAASTPGTCACGKTAFSGGPDEGFASTKSTNTSDLSTQAKLLESQLRFTQILQCITLVFLLGLCVAVVYLLKAQLNHMPGCIGDEECHAASNCHSRNA